MHTVQKPFMCRVGQFEDDKQSLCIGIKTAVLEGKDTHTVSLGNKTYDVDCKKALVLASEKNSFYKDGLVTIVPILLVSKEVE